MEDWDKVIELNLTSVFDLAQWAGNLMVKLGKGKIINIASVNSIAAGINTVAYCSAKGAVMQMTKTIMAVMTALVALSTPAFAAVTNDAAKAVQLEALNLSFEAGKVYTAVAVDEPGGGLPPGLILLDDFLP